MRRNFCDICGELVKDEEFRNPQEVMKEKKTFLEAHRNGRIDIEYSWAVLDKNDEVIHFFSDYDFRLCDKCRDRIESVIWKEIEQMTAERAGKEVITQFILPKFPHQAERIPEPSAPLDDCASR